MTILEALHRADVLCPNHFEEHEKIYWLSQLDGQIWEEIVKEHEGAGEWWPYTKDTALDTELLAPFPFDDIYLSWIEMKIDYYNGETARYNNAAAVFNAKFGEYKNWYTRTHMPMGQRRLRYFGNGGHRDAGPLSD